MKVGRALFSVTDKHDCALFAKLLDEAGVQIVSTGGTADVIRKEGVPVVDVSDVTGFPEMLDGRVKTLHPNIAGGVLALRDNPKHMSTIKEHGIREIDMVVVNLYQFSKKAGSGVGFRDLLEAIDVGGVTLLRAAIKTYPHVVVVSDPQDYPQVAASIAQSGGVSDELAWQLAQKATYVLLEDAKAINNRLSLLAHTGQPACLGAHRAVTPPT